MEDIRRKIVSVGQFRAIHGSLESLEHDILSWLI